MCQISDGHIDTVHIGIELILKRTILLKENFVCVYSVRLKTRSYQQMLYHLGLFTSVKETKFYWLNDSWTVCVESKFKNVCGKTKFLLRNDYQTKCLHLTLMGLPALSLLTAHKSTPRRTLLRSPIEMTWSCQYRYWSSTSCACAIRRRLVDWLCMSRYTWTVFSSLTILLKFLWRSTPSTSAISQFSWSFQHQGSSPWLR